MYVVDEIEIIYNPQVIRGPRSCLNLNRDEGFCATSRYTEYVGVSVNLTGRECQ